MIPVDKLQEILDKSVDSGEECGLQLAVYHKGKLAADLCSGYTSAERNQKVTSDTLFPLFSTGKAIMTTAFHMLKEERNFDYREKVVDYWPEFTGNGKENTEIWHILSHQSGLHFLPGLPDTTPLMADWDLMCKNICAAAPKWPAGTKCGYQGLTYAWLLGELAYRISGIPFKQYMEEKIFRPLGIEKNFYFGITDEADRRRALIDATAFEGKPTWTESVYTQESFRKGFIPCANGIATAKAAATIFNALYDLLSKETIENATQLYRNPNDPIPPNEWAKFGLGYALPNWETKGGDVFGHGGAAGAELLYCKSKELVLCFVKNRPLRSHPLHPVRDRISEALELPTRFW